MEITESDIGRQVVLANGEVDTIAGIGKASKLVSLRSTILLYEPNGLLVGTNTRLFDIVVFKDDKTPSHSEKQTTDMHMESVCSSEDLQVEIEPFEFHGEAWWKCSVGPFNKVVAYGRTQERAAGLALQRLSDELLRRIE